MGYSTKATDDVLTAALWNADVRDQTVVPFATTAARDSAITAPVVGMVAYIKSNNSAEGITTYNSASQWRLPWNMAWGLVASATDTSDVTSVDASKDVVTVTFTAVANRVYRISGHALIGNPSTALTARLFLYIDAGSLGERARGRLDGGTSDFRSLTLVTTHTPSAGSRTYSLRALTNVGTADAQNASAQASIYIEDVGPSGAPT